MQGRSGNYLNRNDIDAKAEEVISHFDDAALSRQVSPIYQVLDGLVSKYRTPFHFDQDLGHSPQGRKILGRYDFQPRQILIDRVLPYDSPRFRWTLCHEIGHLVLHRKIDPKLVSREKPQFVDTRTQLHFIRTANRSELEWIEWQANQFASAMLLPRPILLSALITLQTERGIRRLGSVYLDDQPWNLTDYATILRDLSRKLNVSRTILRIRMLNLGILVDARRSKRS